MKWIRYGRPPKGSRTEQRGLAAQAHIQKEVKYLCEIIKIMGQKRDDLSISNYEITFKELFDVCISSFFLHILIIILLLVLYKYFQQTCWYSSSSTKTWLYSFSWWIWSIISRQTWSC